MAISVLVRCGLLVTVVTAVAAPAVAEPEPVATGFTLDPIVARSLLSPVETEAQAEPRRLNSMDALGAGLTRPPPYRLDRDGDAVTGRRVRISVGVGDTRLFAVGGKLSRRVRPQPADPGNHAGFGPAKIDGGRLYGGGVERRVGPVDVTAAYQYSRITGADGTMSAGERASSHSLQLRARLPLRF